MKLVITAKTCFKPLAIQAADQPPASLVWVYRNEEFELESYTTVRKHYKVVLDEPLANGKTEMFIFADHCTIVSNSAQRYNVDAIPAIVRLDKVPYRNQRNNLLNPDGACNVTSFAMVMLYLNAPRKFPGIYPQFEDELYDYMEDNGLRRHFPSDLSEMANSYGILNRFEENATLDEVKVHLANGNPCVLHGYLTSFGHIIVAVGYDEYGLIVHDPYGEWHSWGYDRNNDANFTKGKFLPMSWDLVRSAFMPDGSLWAHFPEPLK